MRSDIFPSSMRVDSERALILLFLLSSTYMLVESVSFLAAGRVFPLFTSTIVVLGCLLLLFQNHLPESLQKFVSESIDVRPEMEVESEDREVETNISPATFGTTTVGRPIGDVPFVISLTTLFLITSYLVGMTIPSVLFILAYCIWFRQERYRIILLVAIVLAMSFIFKGVLSVPIDRGVILNIMGVM